MKTFYLYIGGLLLLILAAAWFFFPRPSTHPQNGNSSTFGSLTNNTANTPVNSANSTTDNVSQGTASASQKIFKISDGPVAGATLIETSRPTTTVARFVMADNGHAYDIALDSPGAVAKTVSNSTIPGAQNALWVEQGGAAVLQYLEGSVPKTVYLGLPATSTAPVRILFYPDGIVSLAASPSGASVAYLVRAQDGVSGYVAKADGTGSKKLFSLPLKEVQLRWPAQGTLLAYSNAAVGVPGIAFTIDAGSGVVTPLVYAPGLTATADSAFDTVLYQTVPQDGERATYAHNVKTGVDRAISFDPFPEQCVQSPLRTSALLCAVPLSYVAPNFLDLWHQGAASAADSLLNFDIAAGTTTILATPGGADGGVATDMLSIAVSPDGRYALFVSKYDRSLWGVRLVQ